MSDTETAPQPLAQGQTPPAPDAHHGLPAVGGFADNLNVAFGVEQRREAGAYQRLIIDEQDADHSTVSVGNHARTHLPSALDQSITQVVGFNDAAQMVVWQHAPGQEHGTGFLYSGGQYAPLPGTPVAINNQGEVAGLAIDAQLPFGAGPV